MLTRMFGPDALAYRLEDSGCKAAVVDPTVVPKLARLYELLPALETVIVAGAERLPELPERGRIGGCRYTAYGVTHTFLPPTALKMAMQVERPAERVRLNLRAIMSGGEPVNPVILEWRDRELHGVPIHEIYGQTEANLVCGNCSRLYPVRPGSLGRAFPGHEVILVDESGSPAGPGRPGEIAVRGSGDPVVFKEYWRNPEATAGKFHDGWLLTGDMGRQDEEGYFYFEGRKDDVIKSGGYRIGPAEVESSLLTHPAVAEAAAVGVPDSVRGHIVKGFIKLRAGYAASPALAAEIQDHVKARLAAYAYPRVIEFVEELPMTTTGKIRRSELRAHEAARQQA